MTDISQAPVHAPLAHLATQPGYYYLYALYADYAVNNAWFREREYAALLRERLRVIQPLLALVQPYRKSPSLRLFTERLGRERFPPDQVNEAYRELRALIQRVGPPPGWQQTPPPPSPRYRHRIPPGAPHRDPHPAPAGMEEQEGAEFQGEPGEAMRSLPGAGKSLPEADKSLPEAKPEKVRKRYPKSPVNYSQKA